MKLHKIGVFKLTIGETIHRLQSDLNTDDIDFLLDVLDKVSMNTSGKEYNVLMSSVVMKLNQQADRLHQIENNSRVYVPPVEAERLRHGKDLDLLS
tara:strand:+ start:234 stop:521 length:288 start_codon:yes stop_codon:yes gene_type:complete